MVLVDYSVEDTYTQVRLEIATNLQILKLIK